MRRAAIVLIAAAITLAALEGILAIIEPRLPMQHRFRLPAEWQRRQVNDRDFYWHGHLHRFNSLGFRGDEFPSKRKGVMRIAILGDSLTYGYGVGEDQTYSARIEKILAKEYRVDVLNLGRTGMQSEDIVYIARYFLPKLEPDLVLYGICLNDYLPSGTGQTRHIGRFVMAEPPEFRTRIGAVVHRGVHALLIRIGVEKGFMQEVAQAVDRYAERFARDIDVLNRFIRSAGCPPVLAMVLLQEPNARQALETTRRTEDIVRQRGLISVPAESYFAAWKDRAPLVVSPWEGHPNQEAHDAFADSFVAEIHRHPGIRRYINRYKKTAH